MKERKGHILWRKIDFQKKEKEKKYEKEEERRDPEKEKWKEVIFQRIKEEIFTG